MCRLPGLPSHFETILQTRGNLGVMTGVDWTEQEAHVGEMAVLAGCQGPVGQD